MERISSESSPILFWLDCEMTGLEVETDIILEIGIKITDAQASYVIDGPSYVIYQPLSRLEAMGEWCLRTHKKNGLWDESLASTCSMQAAEENMVSWIKSLPYDRERYLAGSSIWCDRMFLKRHMPDLDAMFHYRMLDVSSLKCVFSYALDKPYVHPKSEQHRVMIDVDGSIREYRYYLANMMQQQMQS